VGAVGDDFAFVAASVTRAARLQRAACRRVLEDDTARGKALARHLDLAYEAIERRVADRRSQFSLALDDAEREDAVVEMRRLVWDVRRLQSNLTWLDAAQRPPLDLGTTYFVEDAARALIAADVEVTVISADQPSYATASNPWEPLIAEWGTGIPADEPTVVVIFIPRREERSGLLHPLVMHELGHAVDTEHETVAAIWQLAKGRTRLGARFAKAVTEFSTTHSVDPQDTTDHVASRLRSWIAETFCDCLALHHLGPTYLYSFLAEVAAGSMDEPGPWHPPPRQRIRLLVENLDGLGWSDVLREGDPALESWVRTCIAIKPEYSDVEGFLTWSVDDLRAVVRNQTKRLLRNRIFSPNPEELAEVSQLLAAGIPPAQRRSGEAIARESIMLQCWHAALEGAGHGPAALADAPDAPELSAVLPAALELSALTEAWTVR
jgi:hypothetical protein